MAKVISIGPATRQDQTIYDSDLWLQLCRRTSPTQQLRRQLSIHYVRLDPHTFLYTTEAQGELYGGTSG